MTTIRVGAKSPESLVVTLTPGRSGLNMAAVTECTLHVTRPDGTATTWPTALSSATAMQVIASHEFDADGLETALPGSYVVEPRILAPESRRCEVFKLHVVPYPSP